MNLKYYKQALSIIKNNGYCYELVNITCEYCFLKANNKCSTYDVQLEFAKEFLSKNKYKKLKENL